MADYTPRQIDGVPDNMHTRYEDMLDETHAEVVSVGNQVATVDPWSVGLYADQTATGCGHKE